jgi:ATP-binding cassette subfamily B protein
MTLRFNKSTNYMSIIFKMSKQAWQAQPICSLGMIALELLRGLVPLANAWLMKILFDLLAKSIHGSINNLPQKLLLLLAAQIGISVVNQTLTPCIQYLNTELGRELTLKMQVNIYEKVSSFSGLAYFEDPHFHDTILLTTQRAQHSPIQALSAFTILMQSVVTLLGFIVVLITFNPLLAGVISITVLPQFYAQIKLGRQRFSLAFGNSPKERKASYYGQVLASIPFAKEVRLFTLAGFFLNAFKRITHEIQQSQRHQQIEEIRWQIALASLSSTVASGAFIFVVLQAFASRFSLGDVTLYISAVSSVQSTLAGIVIALSQLNENVLFFKEYITLLALPQPLPLLDHPRFIPSLQSGIIFRNVSFRYSEQHPWVLRHIDLCIPASRCLALVGLNGAGKTTLVKLLARLYDPTEGQILWDGIDIREFDPTALRRRMGAILQDFMRYDLTVRENIGLGNIAQMGDSHAIQQAAVKVGADEFIENLPQGYETTLSRWLVGKDTGVDLSGGEWQKIALARMFMRDVDLLVLDEPTAALDAQSEYALYNHFVELMAGRTSLLITHRFSTVCMADAVAVLENGQITEYGSHNELLALKGTYARLYNMQAERYKIETEPRERTL